MIKRAAIYARVSVDPKHEKPTIDLQVKECRKKCVEKGFQLIEPIFVDRDLSAFKAGVVRPEYEAMKKGVENGEFDVIVAYALDRLSRSLIELLKLIELLNEHDVVLILLSGDLAVDTSTSQGRLIFTVLAALAEWGAARTGELVRDAEASSAAQGHFPSGGRRCYGYDAKGNIIQNEAKHLRQAAEDVLAGLSLRQVTKRMNDRCRTSLGNEWDQRSLKKCLMSPRLRAVRVHNGDFYPGTWKPIFSGPEHLKIISGLNGAKSYRNSPDRVVNQHLLTGLAICGVCGQKLGYGRTKKKNGKIIPRYSCQPAPGTGKCGKISVSEERLDQYVVNAIRDIGDWQVEIAKPRQLSLADEIQALKTELADTDEVLNDLMDYRFKVRPDRMTEPEFAERSEPLFERIDQLTADLNRHESQLDSIPVNRVGLAFRKGSQRRLKGSIEDQRKFLRQYLSSVIVNPAKDRGGRFDGTRIELMWLTGVTTTDADLPDLEDDDAVYEQNQAASDILAGSIRNSPPKGLEGLRIVSRGVSEDSGTVAKATSVRLLLLPLKEIQYGGIVVGC